MPFNIKMVTALPPRPGSSYSERFIDSMMKMVGSGCLLLDGLSWPASLRSICPGGHGLWERLAFASAGMDFAGEPNTIRW